MGIRVGIAGYGWAGGAHIKSFNEIEGVEARAVFPGENWMPVH